MDCLDDADVSKFAKLLRTLSSLAMVFLYRVFIATEAWKSGQVSGRATQRFILARGDNHAARIHCKRGASSPSASHQPADTMGAPCIRRRIYGNFRLSMNTRVFAIPPRCHGQYHQEFGFGGQSLMHTVTSGMGI
ncbi:uncharacterized protein B0H18DRAFT_994172 [Fomitopsis serialis]|uniref:uncharacterized protein n=1 Tax=Fomitopsis serialis TaxID=139415 RepID=UPI0020087B8D|nr:uncharacterized protein B0H18DRAFT_994172 [Neoantrodia serialis]KAH9930285.1 hypothetical protein B0H18DRAFT_994172 [Neoantrodia serialis]